MKNSIAVSLALVVVLWAFWSNLFPNLDALKRPSVFLEQFAALSLSPQLPDIKLVAPNPVASEAWETFEMYLGFAQAHNLKGLKSLSHQLSDACKDAGRVAECNSLMDNVYAIGRSLNQDDFRNAYYDDRQIVLITDYHDTTIQGTLARIALFFTRTETLEPRVLGMKVCLGDETLSNEKCVNTDPATRDTNNNGWWDDVEAKFYK